NKIYCKDRIDKTYGATAFSLGATAREGALISYASGNTSVAAVSAGGKITIKGTGIASITVTAKSTANYKTTSKTITIYVKPKKARIYKATSPKKRTLKATWKRDKKATGYQVICATNKRFTKNKKTALVKKSKTTSKTIKKLKKGKKYYVKVRAYKTARGQKIYGSYSKVKTVRVR
nr:fibronectin type III domain-containing protein [Bacillota bacterium]